MHPPLLWPVPLRCDPHAGVLALPREVRVLSPPEGAGELARLARERVRRALERCGARAVAAAPGPAEVVLALGAGDGAPAEPESYRLLVAPAGVRVAARTAAGLAHGAATLAQLLAGASRGPGGAARVPCLEILDRPAFAERGALLDVSRDRVPRTETLFALVERFASWKLNRLQLYTEHAFAYAAHERVWRDASPFTHDEIRALDRHCRAHGVELVPDQQSFGHLHRWLKHDPYRELAECPEGVEHPFSFAREPFSLCPLDPRSLPFLAGLYDELLPCFSSASFAVGLDETFDLGRGRSRAACAERGTGEVYLDFLRGVHELVAARGKRMRFWADVVLQRPELVPRLPRDAVALLWGYEADHPFEQEARLVAESGLELQVCPGTSSWQSVLGRTANLLANVPRAARAGAALGARGLLVTDWGDRGHLQPLPASFPGWLLAAGAAWNPTAAEAAVAPGDETLGRALDAFALDSPGAGTGAALLDLGRAGEAVGVSTRNASPLSLLLTAFPAPPPAGTSAAGLERARAALHAGAAAFTAAPLASADAALLRREVGFGVRLLELAVDLGLARLAAGARLPPARIPALRRAELAERLLVLEREHAATWRERSREGGLADSLAWLERIRTGLGSGARD